MRTLVFLLLVVKYTENASKCISESHEIKDKGTILRIFYRNSDVLAAKILLYTCACIMYMHMLCIYIYI